jgi:hypothetical protein
MYPFWGRGVNVPISSSSSSCDITSTLFLLTNFHLERIQRRRQPKSQSSGLWALGFNLGVIRIVKKKKKKKKKKKQKNCGG